MRNINDPSGTLFEELFSMCHGKAYALLQTIAASPGKETIDEKIFGWYVGIMRQMLVQFPPLIFRKDYFYKNIVKESLQFIFTLV